MEGSKLRVKPVLQARGKIDIIGSGLYKTGGRYVMIHIYKDIYIRTREIRCSFWSFCFMPIRE